LRKTCEETKAAEAKKNCENKTYNCESFKKQLRKTKERKENFPKRIQDYGCGERLRMVAAEKLRKKAAEKKTAAEI